MSDNVENLYLRGLRQIMGELTIIRRDVADIKIRMSSVERGLGEVQVQLGTMNNRIDHVENRLERLEKRVGLVDETFMEDLEPFEGPKT